MAEDESNLKTIIKIQNQNNSQQEPKEKQENDKLQKVKNQICHKKPAAHKANLYNICAKKEKRPATSIKKTRNKPTATYV